MPELNAKLFGTPAVSVDGREITLPYKKADALLYYLILKRKTTRSELIGLLYEDTDSATALKNLRHAIYTIRKAFAFDPFVPGQRSIVEFSADVEIACDVYDFERGDMLSAYHGEFLKDFNVSHSSAFDAWLSDQRNLYQSQYLHQLLAAEKEAYYAGASSTLPKSTARSTSPSTRWRKARSPRSCRSTATIRSSVKHLAFTIRSARTFPTNSASHRSRRPPRSTIRSSTRGTPRPTSSRSARPAAHRQGRGAAQARIAVQWLAP